MSAAEAAAPADAPAPAALMKSLGKELVEELARSVAVAVNKPVKLADPQVSELSAADLTARAGGPTAGLCLELGGVYKGRAAILLGEKAAVALAGLLKDLDAEGLRAKLRENLSDEDLEDLGVAVSGSLPGIAEKLGGVVGEAPGLGLGDSLLLPEDDFGDLFSLLGPGPYPVASFAVQVEGLVESSGAIVFPSSFAELPEADQGAADAEPKAEEAEKQPGETTETIDHLHPNIRRILRLKLPVSVVLAEKEMPMEAVLRLAPGTIIESNQSSDEDLELRVNDQRIGAGEVVIIGERFGIQLRQIEGLRQRIRKLGESRP
jgi:flagellar motor switch protein FliN/FliY